MLSNPLIDTLMQRASVRSYKEERPSDEVIETIVRAGQQAPFAMQLSSVVMERDGRTHWDAPLAFTLCADAHKITLIARRRGWDVKTNDVTLLLFALQDAAYMAQNMVIAAQSLGLGSCYIGLSPPAISGLRKRFKLPAKVLPLVTLVMGYPTGDTPTRPRYPLSFTLFEGEYPRLTDEQVDQAMEVMDKGYLSQHYYKDSQLMLERGDGREESQTFETYSWTEHMSRKMQWHPSASEILESLKECGFDLGSDADEAPQT